MKTNTEKFEALPLRARKRALLRLALLNAAVSRLAVEEFHQIAVRTLCEEVQISEPTFFNYFSTKRELLTWFIQLWTIEMAAHCRADQAAQLGPLEAIEAIFERTASSAAASPKVMLALISHQTKLTPEVVLPGVEPAVRWLRFPEVAGVESLPAEGFDTLVPPLLKQAVAAGELPESVNIQATMLMLASLFFGTPLLMCSQNPQSIGALYSQQLGVVWSGLRAQAVAL